MIRAYKNVCVLLVLSIAVVSCGSTATQSPSPTPAPKATTVAPDYKECGEFVFAREDPEAFSRYFHKLGLFDAETGKRPETDAMGNAVFHAGQYLGVGWETTFRLSWELCFQDAVSGSVARLHRSAGEGKGMSALQPFEPGSYVLRVIVKNGIVRNIPFVVLE